MEQEVSKKLAKASVSDFFFELQGQKANVYEEELVLDNKVVPVTTIVPSYPTAQAKAYYNAFGLATPIRIVYSNDELNIVYDNNNKPKGTTIKLTFADRLCKEDLNKIAKSKQQSDLNQDFGTFDNFFSPWWEDSKPSTQAAPAKEDQASQPKRGPGRPKESLNRSTIDRQKAAQKDNFGTFDNFFSPWWEDSKPSGRKYGKA